MKKICAIILAGGLLWSGSVMATVYRYVDDQGQERFTNDLSTIPPDKISEVTEIKEIEPDDSTPPAKFPNRSAPLYHTEKRTSNDVLERKKALEAEYIKLFKEKETLDNDASFQKRRHKRKYQNRPYIKELVKKEERIIKRIAEIEELLASFK